MTARLSCCVPFCRCTTRNDKGYADWICRKHWSSVPAETKAAVRKAARTYRKRFGDTPFWRIPPGTQPRFDAVEIHKTWDRAWEACKTAAIETAAGL